MLQFNLYDQILFSQEIAGVNWNPLNLPRNTEKRNLDRKLKKKFIE